MDRQHVFCYLLGGKLRDPSRSIAEEHEELALLEFCFCLVEITLVLYRLCSSPSVPEGFDFHIVVDYSSDGEIIPSRQLEHTEHPPPSYEQIFRSESIREIIQREGSNIAVMQDERRSVTSITSTGTDIPPRTRHHTDIPLTPIGPQDSPRAIFSHSLNADNVSLS
ncbi:hypothetical protein RvY_13778 [Ramazzottius varieornatus]|uniref:Uncharacterized protein n=1 Tax=Ramazzottius varieornatus TaxID=947166 RepID=A0A1D1VUA3_RAMVA|nr:hypothetical protein RvY_13778 [Ramazzottius varieornatus]